MALPEPAAGQVLLRMRAAGLNRGEFIAGHGLTKPGTAKAAARILAEQRPSLRGRLHHHRPPPPPPGPSGYRSLTQRH